MTAGRAVHLPALPAMVSSPNHAESAVTVITGLCISVRLPDWFWFHHSCLGGVLNLLLPRRNDLLLLDFIFFDLLRLNFVLFVPSTLDLNERFVFKYLE